jgi:hypothetical protein
MRIVCLVSVVWVLVGAGVARAAPFGSPVSFALAGGASSGSPEAVIGAPGGMFASVWSADAGLSWFVPRPPGLEVAFQDFSGRSATFSLGTLADDTISRVALNARGVATIAWEQYGQRIFVARCSVRGCSSPSRIGNAEARETEPPFSVLALASDGRRSVVLWPGRKRLRFRVLTGDSFGAAGSLPETGTLPALTTVGRRFVAMWNGRGGLRTAAMRVGGRAFTRPRTALHAVRPLEVQVLSGSRTALVAWRNPAAQLVVADLRGDGSLGPRQTFSDVPASVQLAQGANGRAIIAYPAGTCLSGSPTVSVRVRLREPRHPRFGAPVTLDTEAQCPISTAVDAQGRASVAWIARTSDGGTAPMASVAQSGGPFAPPQTLDHEMCAAPCGTQAIALTTAGPMTAAVWTQGNEQLGNQATARAALAR